MKIKLSNRLAAVADMVLPGKTAADIGTDHGYLPVYLIIENICPYVIASDRAKAPLESARQLVELLSLSKKIDIRLGEGLEVLAPKEAATVCMAGIGGATMRDILLDSREMLPTIERLVMQPMRGAAGLRRFLVENGFAIVREELALDDGFYYEIIAAERGDMTLSEDEAEFGPLLLTEKPALMRDYLELKKTDLMRLIDGLVPAKSQEVKDRLVQLNQMVQRIEKVMNCL